MLVEKRSNDNARCTNLCTRAGVIPEFDNCKRARPESLSARSADGIIEHPDAVSRIQLEHEIS